MSDRYWEPDVREPEVGHLTLWTVWVGGFFMWTVHLAGLSVLVPVVCDRSQSWMWAIHGLTVATGAATIGCIALSAGVWVASRRNPVGGERTRLVGLAGIFLNTISLLLIIGEQVPAVFLEPCA